MQDYLHPPVIDQVDATDYSGRKGETIRMRFDDSVGIAKTRIVIRNCDGKVLERWIHAGGVWGYVTRKNVPGAQIITIELSVTDHAGNTAQKTVSHQVVGKPIVVKPWSYII